MTGGRDYNVKQGWKLLSDQRLKIASFPPMRYLVQNADGMFSLSQVVVVKNRLYQLIAVKRSNPERDADVKRFFDSFAVASK